MKSGTNIVKGKNSPLIDQYKGADTMKKKIFAAILAAMCCTGTFNAVGMPLSIAAETTGTVSQASEAAKTGTLTVTVYNEDEGGLYTDEHISFMICGSPDQPGGPEMGGSTFLCDVTPSESNPFVLNDIDIVDNFKYNIVDSVSQDYDGYNYYIDHERSDRVFRFTENPNQDISIYMKKNYFVVNSDKSVTVATHGQDIFDNMGAVCGQAVKLINSDDFKALSTADRISKAKELMKSLSDEELIADYAFDEAENVMSFTYKHGTITGQLRPAVFEDKHKQLEAAGETVRVTVIEINGDTLLVKPADGSGALRSADRFTVPGVLLPADTVPAAGMELEITFSGGILETWPGQFGNIQKITVINEKTAADETPDLTKGTKAMTLDNVREIAKKKERITWSDLAEYKCEWKGIGAYTHMGRFDLEDGYYLIVEGNPPQMPDVIRLYHRDDVNFIDLRYHNTDKFISDNFFKDFCNMTEDETKAYFAEKGLTEEKGYRIWTAETAARAAENYFVSFLVKLPASYTDSKGNEIINETADVNDLSRMMTDNSFAEQHDSFFRDLNINLPGLCNIGNAHFNYRSEGPDDAKLHRRYISIDVNPKVSVHCTKEEAAEMYADALNYIQLSPQFAGFDLGSKIPSYGADDTAKLKGDANNDGQVDMSDVVLIMQSLANPDKYILSEDGRANADTDGDGVTVGDAQAIQKHLLGIIDYITDTDTIRKMAADFCADQMVNITIVPKDKMPENFADKYVFVRRNNDSISDFSGFEQFLWRNNIKGGIIRYIPYDIDDDSELNKITEKLYLYILENSISASVHKTDDKIIVTYSWFQDGVSEKINEYIAENNIDPDLIVYSVLE